MTSAPMSASIMPQNGPGPSPVISMMRNPLNGPNMYGPLATHQLALIQAHAARNDFFHDLGAAGINT
jgi:hypothetical protein